MPRTMTILSFSGPHQIDPPRPTCSDCVAYCGAVVFAGAVTRRIITRIIIESRWPRLLSCTMNGKSPIRCNGRDLRLLSSAVVPMPIQAVVRRHLALRQAKPEFVNRHFAKALARVLGPKRLQGRPQGRYCRAKSVPGWYCSAANAVGALLCHGNSAQCS
jgi:hypothetical protein